MGSKASRCKKKTEALECLRDEADRAKSDYDELKARAEVQASKEKDALAKVPTLEVQLRLARDNALVQADMITKLKSELSKVMAEIVDARVRAVLTGTKADQEMEVYLKDANDAQAELRRIIDREEKIKEYARCKSRKKTLEEILTRGFVL
ncbi:uncharacterized protein [Nicotiana sylvestris]|uniref:uncharacterized protein n=1 Tax=Nicotiana sylvestris TaxID=4096 RepID=UPI00388C9698